MKRDANTFQAEKLYGTVNPRFDAYTMPLDLGHELIIDNLPVRKQALLSGRMNSAKTSPWLSLLSDQSSALCLVEPYRSSFTGLMGMERRSRFSMVGVGCRRRDGISSN